MQARELDKQDRDGLGGKERFTGGGLIIFSVGLQASIDLYIASAVAYMYVDS